MNFHKVMGESDSMPDHSGHMMPGHGDNSMPNQPSQPMCSMNMLFTWDYTNTCIVFKWWHIHNFFQFLISIIAVILLSMGYEYTRYLFNKWESKQLTKLSTIIISNNNNSSSSGGSSSSSSLRGFKLKKSIFYGFQIGYSFLLMLVFMTYNGWLMLAVAIGAGIGNNLFDTNLNTLNCH